MFLETKKKKLKRGKIIISQEEKNKKKKNFKAPSTARIENEQQFEENESFNIERRNFRKKVYGFFS